MALVLAASILASLLYSTLPSYGPLTLSNTNHSAVIRYDEHGIPRIQAAREADLYFAMGYSVAN
jgi:penicillin amidase